MEDSRSRRIFMLIIIAALLLHLIGLLFFLGWQHHTQEHEKKFQEFMEEVRKQEAQDPEWAETKARASDFGTTVLFQDEPEFTPAAQVAQEKPKQAEKPIAIEKEDPLSLEKIAQVDKESTEIIQEKIEEQPKKEMADLTKPYEQKTPGMAGSGKRDAIPKTSLTLKDIAKGFLHSPRDEGQHDISTLGGKKDAQASAQQLAYQRYVQKLFHCMHNSVRINRSTFKERPSTMLYISIVLERDGTLRNVIQHSSCGSRALDDYHVFIIKDAASSFPPVPSWIPDDRLTFRIVFFPDDEPSKPSFRFSIH